MKWISEEDLARNVVTELQRQGYETYEEVAYAYGSRRADIVGVRGPVVLVVECKMSLSLQLLEQLLGWRGRANYIIGAFPPAKRNQAAEHLARLEGFGLWSVAGDEITTRVSPRLHRRNTTQLRDALAPEQRSGEFARAGTQGGYFTPFRRTCNELRRIVNATPGIELRAALKAMEHHYASEKSAMSALPGLLRKGVIDGVRVEGDRPLRLYVADGTSPAA